MKEEEILVSTRNIVVNYYQPLMELSAALSQLDVLFAFANVSVVSNLKFCCAIKKKFLFLLLFVDKSYYKSAT